MTSFQQWLRQPDDGDIVPVRGVVMRVAADQIGWLEQEVARLKAQIAEAGSPTHLTFRDGESERELIWDGDGYRVPDGAETIDDVRAAVPAAVEAPADASESAPAPDVTGEPAAKEETAGDGGAGAEAAVTEGEPDAGAPDAGDAPDETKTETADDGAGEDEDEDDFELPPEWQ